MSNGDDVLDNWEEIDEAGLNNKLHKIQAERKSLNQENTATTISTSSKLLTALIPSAQALQPSAASGNSFQPMKLLQRTLSQDTTISAVSSVNSSFASPNTSSSSSSALKSPLDDMSASFQPVMMVLHQPADEYQSANYTQPTSSQTVKILRRPTQSSEQRNNGMRPRQPIKTLQQREQEYAEARLRILGSAKNPEDDVATCPTTNLPNNIVTAMTTGTSITKLNTSPKTTITQNSYNNHYQQQQQQQIPANAYNNMNSNYNNQRTTFIAAAVQPQQTWSPIVGGNVSSSSLRQQQSESILRTPRGPDGSTGFQMRR